MKFSVLTFSALATIVGYGSGFTMNNSKDTAKGALYNREKLSDIDLMAIENVAELCLNVESMIDECDLEEHEALVNQLSEQRLILEEEKAKLEEHSRYLDNILDRLRGHEVEGHSLDENDIVYDQ